MSFSKLDALSALRDDRKLGRFGKCVFAMLVTHADGAGYCFPGIDTLAAECDLGRTTVVAALDELERAGWLRRERRGRVGGAGGRTSNGYHLSSPCGQKSVESAPRSKVGGLSPPGGGVSTAPRGGFRPPGDQEAGQGSWSGEASPKAPASGGSVRVAKTPFPDGFAPDAESLEVARKRGVDAAAVTAVLRELATANGWKRACWQAEYRVRVLMMPNRPSGVRSADPDEERRLVNRIVEDAQAGAWGADVEALARELRGAALTALAKSLEHRPKRRLKLAT